jgi:hypothetical protein
MRKTQAFLSRFIKRGIRYDTAREIVKDKQMDRDSYELKKRMERADYAQEKPGA